MKAALVEVQLKFLRDRVYGFGGDTLLSISRIDFGVKYLIEMKKYLANQGIASSQSKDNPVSNGCPLLISLPLLHIDGDIAAVDEQYRQNLHMDWASQGVFCSVIPSAALEFRIGVYKYETASGERTFKELSVYALTALATPLSNAICERVFSQLTCVKTRLRNHMYLEMLDALIRIRTSLKTEGNAAQASKSL
eukprot:gene1729-1927_t